MPPILMERAAELARSVLARRHIMLVRYQALHRRKWMGAVSRVRGERPLRMNATEACQLIGAVTAAARVPGELAELGVADGASARLIAQFAPDRVLHLFDTFAGLPAPGAWDSARFSRGDFRGNLESVKAYLAGARVEFHPGLFPESAAAAADRRFAFVHLDADLYESTRDGLRFFYPRMSRGGIILCHDYLSSRGVDQASAEFFRDKPEPVIELTGYQCLVVKL